MSNFSIVIENNTRYIKIFLKGDRNYSLAIDSIPQALNSSESSYAKFLLVDEAMSCFSVSEVFNIMLEIISIASEKQSLDNKYKLKISYYNSVADVADMVTFAETVAANRGLNFKGFAQESDAISWLEES